MNQSVIKPIEYKFHNTNIVLLKDSPDLKNGTIVVLGDKIYEQAGDEVYYACCWYSWGNPWRDTVGITVKPVTKFELYQRGLDPDYLIKYMESK